MAAALLLVVSVSAGRDAVSARQVRQQTVRRAAADAALVAVRIGGPGGTAQARGAVEVGMRLVNSGPRPVRLVAADLDVDSWLAELPAAPLARGASALLTFRRTVDCAHLDRLSDPSVLLLRVRTADGRVRALALGLGPQDAADPARQVRENLALTPRRSCGVSR